MNSLLSHATDGETDRVTLQTDYITFSGCVFVLGW